MKVFAVIVQKSLYSKPSVKLFTKKDEATQNYDENVKKLLAYYECDEDDERFDFEKDTVTFWDRDESGCDDFYEYVSLQTLNLEE